MASATFLRLLLLSLALPVLAGTEVTVTADTRSQLGPGSAAQLQAQVTGTPDTRVRWAVLEGPGRWMTTATTRPHPARATGLVLAA